MAVYTSVSRGELTRFLERFELGTLESFEGIAAGIENTNYFVTTTSGRFVLTLFEVTPEDDLPFCLDLMAFLAEHGVPSAHPQPDREGRYLQALCGRPAALVKRLGGRSIEHPGVTQCAAIGAMIGYMHRQVRGFSADRDNERGLEWHLQTADDIATTLDPVEHQLLRRSLDLARSEPLARMPRGVIHADLFRDNALFENDELTGIIDFYYAHTGPLIYDLAVTLADWCYDADGSLRGDQARALVGAYREARPVEPTEIQAFPDAVQAAGLRFWLSRAKDKAFPREGEITQIKDPLPFRRVMEHADGAAEELIALW